MNQTLEMHEVLRAEQSPDIYDGPDCDQVKARWIGSADVDKDGPGEMGDPAELLAKHFPPGTVVSVKVPLCPDCGEGFDCSYNHESGEISACNCGFDWPLWTDHRYS